MSGLNQFLWRSTRGWPEVVAAAEAVLARWNTVTEFITRTDQREHIWTVRHHSVAQPFMVLNADNLRGSVPRIGNPMPMLLLLGIGRQDPGAIEISFANGQKIDPARFEVADLTGLLPHATHAAHRKLAELLPPAGAGGKP
ncbi:MAG: hypothetical protein CGU28_08860 [Candidatus Dactylopiibacterium carminicum]|uniref:Uncharacterized protein n=1 Tax=Candidatus Dactylopiibacterium carminicum TaxID=857335 RepID=A0A272EWJ0_9RHOO|nr:hypothetical protein [Candidatus Dactylopiibacterium carminicum]KAF7599991.1 hypothetical protein BGI27_05245 [Candidatus Dactylopiibacterium carminicum]PAS94426.1 MAG: hypothetical protein CGU29_03695 [Candidatus Dactylopiibacterium carminicum]PAS96411.1 MAG: hypothetical protein CGU28_08860 [Candidatus Dactylopiibacterium carminicum]PAS99994.1 MAG: hypothetical protein BSR46_05280 [Candidatus Dactylopiibacterium carminicum]